MATVDEVMDFGGGHIRVNWSSSSVSLSGGDGGGLCGGAWRVTTWWGATTTVCCAVTCPSTGASRTPASALSCTDLASATGGSRGVATSRVPADGAERRGSREGLESTGDVQRPRASDGADTRSPLPVPVVPLCRGEPLDASFGLDPPRRIGAGVATAPLPRSKVGFTEGSPAMVTQELSPSVKFT